ncbi:PREDICTED: 15-hydroxyprostaglandin dehydrogenase [NAD(+)]-like [Nicrophorus vespilloides]|uniref:15-hydroxyprostaglandin dehydrogenase [NAD(+)]-like n=1 Tax=Nicrophorus vespilloides TaxID=110193 RepID=A0ABM1M486_NICVS|nr:PREDICTED: 15-hydroxyprostaglandin dehydrogenase [NAD(+)]-like [Nicrophorus vespilloides]
MSSGMKFNGLLRFWPPPVQIFQIRNIYIGNSEGGPKPKVFDKEKLKKYKDELIGKDTGKNYNYVDKVAIITGGASGIGYEFAKTLADKKLLGVVIADINVEAGETAVRTLGNNVMFVKTNVQNNSELKSCFRRVMKKYHKLDLLINNAGIYNERSVDKVLNTNVRALMYGTFYGFMYMGKHRRRHGGIIINVSSVAGIRQYAGFPLYTGASHFVVGFSRSMGTPFFYDLTGVKVFTICPGFTDTHHLKDINVLRGFDDLKSYTISTISSKMHQSPSVFGPALITVIENGRNGCTWVVENGKPAYEVSPKESTVI